jgi:hypothetical protein
MAKPDGYLLSGLMDNAEFSSQISGFTPYYSGSALHKKTTNSPFLQNNDKNNMTIELTAA